MPASPGGSCAASSTNTSRRSGVACASWRVRGAREPEVLGDALRLLLEGGYYTRLVFSSGGPVSSIVKAVRALLDAHGVPALESG